MDIVFKLRGHTSISTRQWSFSSNSGPISAASARPGCMDKNEEKKKVDWYPRMSLVPFILETTGRPGYHAQKFIKHFFSDTEHPPTSIWDACRHHVTPGTCSSPLHTQSSLAPTTHSCSLHVFSHRAADVDCTQCSRPLPSTDSSATEGTQVLPCRSWYRHSWWYPAVVPDWTALTSTLEDDGTPTCSNDQPL